MVLSYPTVVPAPQPVTRSTSNTTSTPVTRFCFEMFGFIGFPLLPLSNHCSPLDDQYRDQGQQPAMKTLSTPGVSREGIVGDFFCQPKKWLKIEGLLLFKNSNFWYFWLGFCQPFVNQKFCCLRNMAFWKNTVSIGGWHSRTVSNTQ